MLITCDRHTKKDLELWEEYQQSDLIHFEMNKKKFEYKIEKALNEIKNFNTGSEYVSVSWGKDSIALLHLCLTAQIKLNVVYVKPLYTFNPYCLNIRDWFISKFNFKYNEIEIDYGNDYYNNSMVEEKDSDKIFLNAFKQFGNRRYIGIRASESGIRRISRVYHGISTENVCRPIIDWKEQDIFSYLAYNDLPIHPNYAMLGNGRYERNRLRVDEIGGVQGNSFGKSEWEKEYYPDILRKIETLGRARNKIK